MNQYFKYLIVLLFAIAGISEAEAQAVKVDARLEKATLPIGDQTKLHLTVHFPAKDSVSFPALLDSIKAKLLIVSVNKPDTSFDKNDISIETIDRSYTLTSFDSGQYVIPQYDIKTKSGIFKTPELVLTVKGIAVDTTKGVFDIKEPLKIDYSWKEWLRDNWPKIAFPILAILVIAGIIYYLRKRPKKEIYVAPPEPEKPAHVVALNKLYALQEQKLWQQNRTKEYHSEISDILRDYLEKRYHIHANEQTTDEIFASIRYMDINEADRAKLKQILVMADLVKFAKEKPLAADNEFSMNNAIDFVVKTQREAVTPTIKKKERTMAWFKGIEFAAPGFFWLLIIIPLMLVWYFWQPKRQQGTLSVPTLKGFYKHSKSWFPHFRHSVIVLRCLALITLIIALARPQSSLSWQNSTTEGIDIVIASDISGSMLAEDFKPNRLEAGKNIAIDFIKNRPDDRIGLVIFSGESFTQCPLTIDHSVLINLYQDIKNGMIEDGTAIGMGLATAVNRLKDSKAKSKVIILLTDGVNNMGSIPPITAAEIAKQFGIRVYTVGIGTIGTAPYPVPSPYGGVVYQRMEVKIDEPTMTKIAQITGGQYFRATNNETLRGIYGRIDQLEKAKIDVTQYRKKTEMFLPFAAIALLLLLLEFALKNTIFKGALT